jgi:5-hydroxyisourate hydrolase
MTVSTHVLDASLGVPAAGVPVTLARLTAAYPGAPASDSPDIREAAEDQSQPTGLPEPAGPGQWVTLEAAVTDAEGRHRFTVPTPTGAYRLTFTTGTYFAARGVPAFYPEVMITFMVTKPPDPPADGKAVHFHVPLLLSPFAYSTYRGS